MPRYKKSPGRIRISTPVTEELQRLVVEGDVWAVVDPLVQDGE